MGLFINVESISDEESNSSRSWLLYILLVHRSHWIHKKYLQAFSLLFFFFFFREHMNHHS